MEFTTRKLCFFGFFILVGLTVGTLIYINLSPVAVAMTYPITKVPQQSIKSYKSITTPRPVTTHTYGSIKVKPTLVTKSFPIQVEPTRENFEKLVTVLLFSRSMTGHCILNQVDAVRKVFSKIHIVAYPAMDLNIVAMIYNHATIKSGLTNTREGKSLNFMISNAKTDYVLYLPRGAMFADFDSPASPKWLLDILLKNPGIDIAGGVISWPGKSNVDNPCRNQDTKETLKLQESIAKYKQKTDYAVCDVTSMAFLARTSAMKDKIGKFSPEQSTGIITEFFKRAKSKSAKIAHLRHVVFTISQTCVDNNIGDKGA